MTGSRERDESPRLEIPRRDFSGQATLNTDSLTLLTGASNPQLARDTGKILQSLLDEPITVFEPLRRFADGEAEVTLPESIRRKHAVIIHPTSPPVDSSIMELMFMMSAVRKASPREMTVVIPYFGYSRGDHAKTSRQAISAQVVAQMIEIGKPDAIITVDLHSQQQDGFFRIPTISLSSASLLIERVKELTSEDDLAATIVVSPDNGGVKKAQKINRNLGDERLPIAVIDKERSADIPDQTEAIGFSGNVEGSRVIIVDDILGTGGSIRQAAEMCLRKGAKSVDVMVAHAVWAGDAYRTLMESGLIRDVYTTDSIAQPPQVIAHPRIQVVPIAPLLAETIRRVRDGDSVSSLNT